MKQIPLYRGYRWKRKIMGYAMVDDCYEQVISKHYWTLQQKYPQAKIRYKTVRLHIFVWELAVGNIPTGYNLDHIDRNRLNNQISNLRLVTPTLNSANKRVRTNKSGYHGVCWLKKTRQWQAKVTREGKDVLRAYFKNKDEAAEAVNEAYRKYYPELAIPNSIIPKW